MGLTGRDSVVCVVGGVKPGFGGMRTLENPLPDCRLGRPVQPSLSRVLWPQKPTDIPVDRTVPGQGQRKKHDSQKNIWPGTKVTRDCFWVHGRTAQGRCVGWSAQKHNIERKKPMPPSLRWGAGALRQPLLFHILDPTGAPIFTIKDISGHLPFPAQVILNGHEFTVPARGGARAAHHPSPRREGTTALPTISDAAGLAHTKIPQTNLVRGPRAYRARLSQVWLSVGFVTHLCIASLARLRTRGQKRSGEVPLPVLQLSDRNDSAKNLGLRGGAGTWTRCFQGPSPSYRQARWPCTGPEDHSSRRSLVPACPIYSTVEPSAGPNGGKGFAVRETYL